MIFLKILKIDFATIWKKKNQFITGGQILFKNSSVLFYWNKVKSLIQQ